MMHAADDHGADVAVHRDLVYASPGGRDLLIDLYVPRVQREPRPVIVWLHGGGWRIGNRRMAPDLHRWYAERGYCMASIDYRLSSEAIFPAAVEDVKTAIRWLKTTSATYGIDPNRIALWGSSAGGHLAALATTSGPGWFEGTEHLGQDSTVAALVDAYGPTDFLQMDAQRDPTGSPSDDQESIQLPPGKLSSDADSPESLFLGAPIETCPHTVRMANPLTYVTANLPPFLILHGESDTAVPAHQSRLLYDALAAADNDVTLGLIQRLGHGFLNRNTLDDVAWEVEIRGAVGGSDQVTRARKRIFEWIGDWFDTRLHWNKH